MVQMGKINWMKVHCSKFEKERDHHHCPGGSLSGGIPGQGGLCPGGSLSSGDLCQWDPPRQRTPLYSEEREVRILLECFLVLISIGSRMFLKILQMLESILFVKWQLQIAHHNSLFFLLYPGASRSKMRRNVITDYLRISIVSLWIFLFIRLKCEKCLQQHINHTP